MRARSRGLCLAALLLSCSRGGLGDVPQDGADIGDAPDLAAAELGPAPDLSAALGLEAVSPAASPLAGGITVTLKGRRFAAGMTVRIAGVAANQVSVLSPTEARVLVPPSPGQRGKVPIEIGTAEGSARRGDLFSYYSDQLRFVRGLDHSVGELPSEVVLEDLSGDGALDAVVLNLIPQTLTTLIGDGKGSFGPGRTVPTGAPTNAISALELTGDGKMDLVGGRGDGTAAVYAGQGDGTFAAARTFKVGKSAVYAAAGDLDRDGRADLVVANQGGADLSVLLGRGGGDFAPAVSYAAEAGPTGVLVRDFDGDGKLDVFVGNQAARSASFLPGRGDGTLGAARSIESDIGAHQAAAADLDLDGKLDVAINNANSDSVSVFLNDGAGGFRAARVIKVCNGKSNQGLVAADLNGDAVPDLAVACLDTSGATILLGQGDGAFQAPRTLSLNDKQWAIASGDLNRDGKIDLLFTLEGRILGVMLNGG